MPEKSQAEIDREAKAAVDAANLKEKTLAEEELQTVMDPLKGVMAHKHSASKSLSAYKVPVMKRVVKSHAKKVYSARWAEDSLHICTAGQEGNVLVTNASTGVITKLPIKTPFVMQCAMYKDLVACGGMKNLIELWSVAESKPTKKKDFEGHEGYISQLHFMDGGTKLLSGSGDGTARLYDCVKMTEISSFWGHEADVSGVCIASSDSKIFGTSSTDKMVRIWDMRQKYAVRKFTAKYANNCCAMYPESRGIVVGCDNASYEFFSVECNAQIARGKVKKGRCESIALSASGRVTYAGWDNAFMLVADSFTPDNRKEITKETSKDMHEQSICSLAVAPDGSALLTGSFDTTAKVWGAEEVPA